MNRFTLKLALAILALSLLAPAGFATGPNFPADYKFAGSSVTSLKQLGDATWKAENGVITGKPDTPSGGWLVLDKSMADVAVYLDLRCTAQCKTGVLLRAEKTGSGWKGIFVSMSPGDRASYAITLDASGKEISRKLLAKSTGEGGLANSFGNMSPEILNFIRKNPAAITPLPQPKGVHLADLDKPSNTYHPGDWNDFNILLYNDMLDPHLGAGGFTTDGTLVKSAAPPSDGAYGPIALYVGGEGEVRFKNLQYQNLNTIKAPREYVSPAFSEQHVNGFYFSWSTAVADFNHDGIPDIVAGPYYYLGPSYTEAHEIYVPRSYNAGTEYPQESMVNLAADFTGDGWPDILVMSGSAGQGTATLYVNPRGEARHWEHHVVIHPLGNEDTLLADIDGDGRPEVIHAGDNTLQYSKPDPVNATGKWITTTISEPGPWGASIGHGLGVADINGDGLMDFINSYGWWEHPAKDSQQKLWTYHPEAFGRWGHTAGGAGGAELGVYDVNGDGLADVVASLEGHGFGLAWFEQKRDASGHISFERHIIMDNFLTKNAGNVIFTEPHATAFADMNGDGIKDLITGKRAMSHLYDYGDPDPFGPAVLYVYTVVRDSKAPGGARFEPTLVHNMSGVGSHFAVTDLNRDGTPDITTSGIYGTFIFFNHMKQRKSEPTRR